MKMDSGQISGGPRARINVNTKQINKSHLGPSRARGIKIAPSHVPLFRARSPRPLPRTYKRRERVEKKRGEKNWWMKVDGLGGEGEDKKSGGNEEDGGRGGARKKEVELLHVKGCRLRGGALSSRLREPLSILK